jgi:hypothetical protein
MIAVLLLSVEMNTNAPRLRRQPVDFLEASVEPDEIVGIRHSQISENEHRSFSVPLLAG